MGKVINKKNNSTAKGKIISEHEIFWCDKCKRKSFIVYKWNGESYCEECVPDKIKDSIQAFNHNTGNINYK